MTTDRELLLVSERPCDLGAPKVPRPVGVKAADLSRSPADGPR